EAGPEAKLGPIGDAPHGECGPERRKVVAASALSGAPDFGREHPIVPGVPEATEDARAASRQGELEGAFVLRSFEIPEQRAQDRLAQETTGDIFWAAGRYRRRLWGQPPRRGVDGVHCVFEPAVSARLPAHDDVVGRKTGIRGEVEVAELLLEVVLKAPTCARKEEARVGRALHCRCRSRHGGHAQEAGKEAR